MKLRSVACLQCFALCITASTAFAQDTSTKPSLGPDEAIKKLEQLGLIKNRAITSEDFLSQIEADNVETVKLFLTVGVDSNIKDQQGRYPLIVVADSGYADIVRMLLDAGADVNVKDRFGRTPLVVAVSSEQDAVFKMLVANAKQ